MVKVVAFVKLVVLCFDVVNAVILISRLVVVWVVVQEPAFKGGREPKVS